MLQRTLLLWLCAGPGAFHGTTEAPKPPGHHFQGQSQAENQGPAGATEEPGEQGLTSCFSSHYKPTLASSLYHVPSRVCLLLWFLDAPNALQLLSVYLSFSVQLGTWKAQKYTGIVTAANVTIALGKPVEGG